MKRFLKWTAMIIAMCLIIGITTMIVWSFNSTRSLDARVAAIKAAGEPILPSDFALNLPAEEDMMVELRLAHAMLERLRDERWKRLREIDPEWPLSDDERDLIAAVVESASPVFALIDAASTKAKADWQSFPDAASLAGFNGRDHRDLATLVRHKALLDAHDGRHDQVANDIHRIMALGDAAEDVPSAVGHMVAIGIGAGIVGDVTVKLSPELTIGESAPAVTPGAAKRLIDRLLDDQATTGGMSRAFRGERALQLAMAEALMQGQPVLSPGPPPGTPPGGGGQNFGSAFGSVVGRPYVRSNAALLLDHMTAAIAVIDKVKSYSDWKTQTDSLETMKQVRSSPRRYLIAGALLPNLDMIVSTHFNAINERRAAAIALAVRWYALEHGGELPPTLDALVPRYLPHVPKDALSVGEGHSNRPFGYDPDRRIIWHCGENHRNDGGREPDPTQTTRWNNQNADVVYALYRKPATRPATTSPSP